MEAESAKRIIDKNLQYDEVKRLIVKLVQHASPQTEQLEAEPQVLALIRDVIKPELEQARLHPSIDDKGNLILRLNGRGRGDRAHARRLCDERGAKHHAESLFRRNRRRRAVRTEGRVCLGPRRLRAEGQPRRDDSGYAIHRRPQGRTAG